MHMSMIKQESMLAMKIAVAGFGTTLPIYDQDAGGLVSQLCNAGHIDKGSNHNCHVGSGGGYQTVNVVVVGGVSTALEEILDAKLLHMPTHHGWKFRICRGQ